MGRYAIRLHPDRENGGYRVTVPALPGSFSQGDTLEEAIANAREAIAGHFECLRELSQPVPEEPEEGGHEQTLVIDVAA